MDIKTQAILNALVSQRNQAMDAVAQLNGELAERDARITELEAKLKPAE